MPTGRDLATDLRVERVTGGSPAAKAVRIGSMGIAAHTH
jgi:hypothetical protein